MEIKITIDDIDEGTMNKMASLTGVLAHLLGDTSVTLTAPLEGEQQMTDGIDLDDLPGKVVDNPVKPTKWPCNWCSRTFNKPAQLNKHLDFCKVNPKNVKASTTERACRDCETSKTPQWRDTKHPDGPRCNACYMKAKRAKRDFNPFAKQEPTEAPKQRRVIEVKRTEKKPTYTKMDLDELRFAVAGYVAGNNGLIMHSETLAMAMMSSLEKRYVFVNRSVAERELISRIGLQFKYIENALNEAKRRDVTYILQSKDGGYSMMILKSSGPFEVDEIREMLDV